MSLTCAWEQPRSAGPGPVPAAAGDPSPSRARTWLCVCILIRTFPKLPGRAVTSSPNPKPHPGATPPGGRAGSGLAPPAPPAALPVALSQGLLPLGPPQPGHRFPGPGLRCRRMQRLGARKREGPGEETPVGPPCTHTGGPLGSVACCLQTSQTPHQASGRVSTSSPQVSSPRVSNL